MTTDLYNSLNIQILLFICLAIVLLVSVASLFIKPAKRTIRASLVEAETGHIIDVSRAETSIGRAKSCDIVISDASVSRFHAVLSKRSSGWYIFDTNSTHGIIHNREIVEKKSLLSDGDSLVFGKTEYIFYSTAVTTRQQVVPKTNNEPQEDRPKYKTKTKEKTPNEARPKTQNKNQHRVSQSSNRINKTEKKSTKSY